MRVSKNLESVFTGAYLNYSYKPSESEESIAERRKLRIQRSDEIAKKENMIDPELFRIGGLRWAGVLEKSTKA